MVEISEHDFELAVRDALDEVPPQLLDLLDNVAFFVEDEPSADEPEAEPDAVAVSTVHTVRSATR